MKIFPFKRNGWSRSRTTAPTGMTMTVAGLVIACGLLLGAAESASQEAPPPAKDESAAKTEPAPEVQVVAPGAPEEEATPSQEVQPEAPKEAKPVKSRGPKKAARKETAPDNEANLRFNFRDVPLDTVLDYLSQTAGFIIVREVKVEGKIDVLSHQPLNKDDAVALLNTVLNNRGYAAIREGRTLTIVKREDAKFRDIPVKMGHDADEMPKSGEVITQIIPVTHTDATQLLENLTPLLPPGAIANANKSSNAIVLTDTETDVKRMATIIEALDSSISNISEVRVFSLTYSKAADTAKLITTLFQPPAQQGPQGPPGPGGFMAAAARFLARGRRGGPAAPTPNVEESAAKQAATHVVAVADERTNAVVVAAPTELLTLIESVIKEIDRISVPTTEVRVFALERSDPTEMAQVINDAVGQTTSTSSTGSSQQQRYFGGAAKHGGGPAPKGASDASTSSSYAHATADMRTRSVVVTAEPVMMEQVAHMIEQLESNRAKDFKVFTYKMKNADVQQVAAILQGMVNKQTTMNQPRQQPTTTSTSSTRTGTNSTLGGRSSLLGR